MLYFAMTMIPMRFRAVQQRGRAQFGRQGSCENELFGIHVLQGSSKGLGATWMEIIWHLCSTLMQVSFWLAVCLKIENFFTFWWQPVLASRYPGIDQSTFADHKLSFVTRVIICVSSKFSGITGVGLSYFQATMGLAPCIIPEHWSIMQCNR